MGPPDSVVRLTSKGAGLVALTAAVRLKKYRPSGSPRAAGAVSQPMAHLPMLLSIESQSTPSGQLLPSAPRQPVWQEPSPLQTQPLCGPPQSESTLHEQ